MCPIIPKFQNYAGILGAALTALQYYNIDSKPYIYVLNLLCLSNIRSFSCSYMDVTWENADRQIYTSGSLYMQVVTYSVLMYVNCRCVQNVTHC